MRRSIIIYLTGIISAFMFTGCNTTVHFQDRQVNTQSIDFSKYTEQGFLFTFGDYTYNYESVGITTVTIWPAVKKYRVGAKEKGYTIIRTSNGDPKAMWKPLKLSELFDEAFDEARDMGGDALIRMDFKTVDKNVYLDQDIEGLQINGLVIDRKDND